MASCNICNKQMDVENETCDIYMCDDCIKRHGLEVKEDDRN